MIYSMSMHLSGDVETDKPVSFKLFFISKNGKLCRGYFFLALLAVWQLYDWDNVGRRAPWGGVLKI